jgi:DNA-binding HxlR family transcriptional regulator
MALTTMMMTDETNCEDAMNGDTVRPARLVSQPVHQPVEQFLCPVDEAARVVGHKWTLQIVHHLLDSPPRRFCDLQEALGGVNPSTLSSRLKMLEEVGLVHRIQISAIPPHVEYSLTEMGYDLRNVISEIARWSNLWLCSCENGHQSETHNTLQTQSA